MQTSCVVDEKFVPKVGMIFKTLEEARKFYKHYSKLAGFSTKIRNTTRDREKIKNQLIVCSREGRWKSKISPTLNTNPSAGLNCPARIYVHIMKDVGLWTISKVVLNHSHPCCLDQPEMLKQHRELSMFVRRTIETYEEARIRPSKTYQSFVAAAGSHRELDFIEKDVRNYITREVRNISEEDDAKEFGKYLVRMKEKNQNFFFELNLEGDHCIKHAFWADARSRDAFDYFGDMVSFDTTYNTNKYNLVLGSFVGVNHHGQSTLLGYALMKNEDFQSFKWLATFHGSEGTKRNWIYFLRKYGLEGNKWLSASKEQEEREFHAADFHTVILCAKKLAIETQLQHVYTHEKFREVQAQFRGKVNCITRSIHSTLGFTTYEVIEQVSNSTFNKFVVTYDAVSRDVKCHWFLFESRGIFCRHSLSVLSFERVDNVAPKYILECWSKNIKRRHTHINSRQDEPLLGPRSKRFDELVFRSHNICEFTSESEELTGISHRAFDKVMAEMEEYQERSKRKSLLTHEEATLSSVNDLQSPPHVKIRGQPKNRLGSNLEKKISNAMKKKKKTAPSELKLTCF
ncbi:protein FAR-RED IMPAIRED RESPONSE 1-like [Arachis hypogaea]|uniref:protein FAR-RED IMPAIRED RESPONSE 1-like n=1 Tax=Arachis hypogaea TaxID=3818 RepID=UPI000DECD46F|nr:protein FAR1-RELATED SEQUENCE 4-like [Arachis hypogaea]